MIHSLRDSARPLMQVNARTVKQTKVSDKPSLRSSIMAYKDLLLHIDDSKAGPARLVAAVNLARAHDAHLTGLYVIPLYTIPPYAEAQIGHELIAAQEQAAKERAQAVETRFRAAVAQAGISAEWRCVEGDWVDTLQLHAHYTDLVILGQADGRDPASINAGFAEQVVLSCGRPVLFVPYIGVTGPIGERVMVAWKSSRESVRALNDALPLLEQARRVDVVTVNPNDDEGDMPGADICLYLARHGVKAEAHKIIARDIDIGNLLLSRAADEGIDLIVMGAYGHSRFREMILGGATRHTLQHMTVPVLMSH